MTALLLSMAEYLRAKGLVEGDGIDTYRDFTPESPDNVVVLHEYIGGEIPYYDIVTTRAVQITVRNLDANAAREKALAICKSLISENTIVHFTLERWGQVTIKQSPFKLGQDKNSRVTYCFNVGIKTTVE